MVAYYFNNPHLSGIFRFYAGYISLIPNMIGLLATSLFPLYITPYIMIAFSLAFATTLLSLFSLRRYRFIMPSDKARMLVCLLLAFIPRGNYAVITSLTFSMWHIFMIALAIIIAPFPKSNRARVGQCIFLALSICSHPSSFLFIPICLVLLFIRPSLPDRIVNSGIILMAVLYGILGIETAKVLPIIDSETFLFTFKFIMHRVIFESVLGGYLRSGLQHANQSLVINIFALWIVNGLWIVILLSNEARKSSLQEQLSLFGLICYVIFLMTFIAVAGRSMTDERYLLSAWEHRYYYTQQSLFVFIILLHIFRLINWKMLSNSLKIAILILICSYFSYLNIYNTIFFTTSKEEGIMTIGFLQSVSRRIAHSEEGENYPQQMILKRGGQWDIKINLYNDNQEQLQ